MPVSSQLHSSMVQEIINIVDEAGKEGLLPSVSGGGIGDAQITRQAYKAGCYGDSRTNASWFPQGGVVAATNYQIAADKPISWWIAQAGNLRLAFMGGISGDTVALWRAARANSRSFTDAIAADLDVIYVQYCINDIIGWNGSSPSYAVHIATIFENWKACITEFLKAGIKVVAESTQPANDISVSNYTGWANTGGYGASAALKAQMTAELVDLQAAYVASLDQKQIRFVDTHNTLLDPLRKIGVTATGRPYGYADMSKYGDGTHMTEAAFAWVGLQVAAASNALLPAIAGKVLLRKFAGPSYLNSFHHTPTSGLAFGVTTSQDAGTWAVAGAVGVDSVGAYQEIVGTPTALASGIATLCINFGAPITGATPSYAVTATDQIGAQAIVVADNGSGGPPPIIRMGARQRYFITAGGSVFSDGLGVSSTTFGPLFSQIFSAPVSMRIELPEIIPGQLSAALSAGSVGSAASGLMLFIYTTQTGAPIRIRVYLPVAKRTA